jgi:very-short-patch-repair endonuclease
MRLRTGNQEGRQRRDVARDHALGALCWRVLRVADQDVFADLDAVVARIVTAGSEA